MIGWRIVNSFSSPLLLEVFTPEQTLNLFSYLMGHQQVDLPAALDEIAEGAIQKNIVILSEKRSGRRTSEAAVYGTSGGRQMGEQDPWAEVVRSLIALLAHMSSAPKYWRSFAPHRSG